MFMYMHNTYIMCLSAHINSCNADKHRDTKAKTRAKQSRIKTRIGLFDERTETTRKHSSKTNVGKFCLALHSRKLTWIPKMIRKRQLPLKVAVSGIRVGFLGCTSLLNPEFLFCLP